MNVERSLLRTFLWPLHRALFRISGGRLGTREPSQRGMGTLMLTTTGRRSGEKRTVPVYYMRDGDRLVVVASNAGDDRQAAWYLNLQASPAGQVRTGHGASSPVSARDATDDERARLWPELVRLNPGYKRYERRTARRIPIVVLETA